MDLLSIVRRVRAGVKLLDKKIPNWRTVMRKHQDQFDFADGSHCVLGTLEHYSGRMRELKKRSLYADEEFPFTAAAGALDIDGDEEAFGFDGASHADEYENEIEALSALWRAEFER